jgi:DNA ligase (NAD+)
MLNDNQQEILRRSDIVPTALDEAKLFQIAHRECDEAKLSDAELVEFLAVANALYRGGEQIVSDAEYDFTFVAELRNRHPNHPLLSQVEPEAAFLGKTVELPVRMLSTDKAYSRKEVERWAGRIEKAAAEVGKDFGSVTFRLTPKLDGYAAYDDGERLYTRGDGRKGTDISRVFERGLAVAGAGKRGLGAGEIVVGKRYFAEHLAVHFDNSRNFQASIIKEKDLEEPAEKAIRDKAAVFHPFALLPCWEGTWPELAADFDARVEAVWNAVDYDVDGVILEIADAELKEYLGATRHHHRWQIAYKKNIETARVKILRVLPQTSRSGRVTPVAEVEPVKLSGATIHRATAHHYRLVLESGIGPGALIELARSGEVIPKIEKVLQPAEPDIPSRCPSCSGELTWDGDYLCCTNNFECPAQIANTLEHFFHVLGNIDGFGAATVEKLYAHGIRSVDQIYALPVETYEQMGFGPKQAQNLQAQLTRSRSERIEDWRFLAAFGVFRMGQGNCEKLLAHYPLTAIFGLSEQDIVQVEGFAEKTAAVVMRGLKRIKPLFDKIYGLGFSLEATPRHAEPSAALQSPIAGKLLVFTGTMQHGSREEMEREAKLLGAKVGKSVSGKTDWLVAGENVGAAKLLAAQEKGVAVIGEADYLKMLKRDEN